MKTLIAPARVALASLFVLSPLVAGGPAYASGGKTPTVDQLQESVQVTGHGSAFARPDTLNVNFGVETSGPQVDDALKRAGVAGARMRDTLVRGGVTKADLQTSNVGVNATRKDDGVITGYIVSQGLTAKIRNLSRSGALISATVTAGGDAARLNGVSFAIEDDAALLAEARKKAFADARTKAGLYAREAGRPLGRVVKVIESSPTFWRGDAMDKFAPANSSVPVEPGRQELAVTITVEWALDPSPASKSTHGKS